jgi:hypothetical protein
LEHKSEELKPEDAGEIAVGITVYVRGHETPCQRGTSLSQILYLLSVVAFFGDSDRLADPPVSMALSVIGSYVGPLAIKQLRRFGVHHQRGLGEMRTRL